MDSTKGAQDNSSTLRLLLLSCDILKELGYFGNKHGVVNGNSINVWPPYKRFWSVGHCV